ncbi:MAG: hypothetical protein HW412_1312, partial [Bacteroidetes bacterium]|nr:hypothetical protein [Bacteroidota bacterium]
HIVKIDLLVFTSSASHLRHAQVVQNPVEPCSELRISAELIQTLKRSEKRILHQLLSFTPVPRKPNCKRERPILVPINQKGIPTGVSRPNLLYYVLFGLVHLMAFRTCLTPKPGRLFQVNGKHFS